MAAFEVLLGVFSVIMMSVMNFGLGRSIKAFEMVFGLNTSVTGFSGSVSSFFTG